MCNFGGLRHSGKPVSLTSAQEKLGSIVWKHSKRVPRERFLVLSLCFAEDFGANVFVRKDSTNA